MLTFYNMWIVNNLSENSFKPLSLLEKPLRTEETCKTRVPRHHGDQKIHTRRLRTRLTLHQYCGLGDGRAHFIAGPHLVLSSILHLHQRKGHVVVLHSLRVPRDLDVSVARHLLSILVPVKHTFDLHLKLFRGLI